MLKKAKRILWLLNHKTLMQYEIPLLQELGYKVFIPKIIPTDPGFRSGDVSYESDEDLDIPPHVLRILNAWNCYEGEWPSDVLFYLNRYFGSMFVMPLQHQFREAITRFEGAILLRAFGLDNTMTYAKVLNLYYGRQVESWINSVGNRFWFAQGYEQLKECEPDYLANRSVFLPIGLSDHFWSNAARWTGEDKRILFVCPNLVTNPYYAEIYRQFKQNFGDLPHVIVGAQDVPCGDPHVLGFVTNAQLTELYAKCSVLFYHSRELRHVHYSPIEATIIGTPIVFFEDSLLARVCKRKIAGSVETQEEARALIERILSEDMTVISALRKDQADIAYHFSHAYCKPQWKQSIQESSWSKRLESTSIIKTMMMEIKRGMTYRRRYSKPDAAPPKEVTLPPLQVDDQSVHNDDIDPNLSEYKAQEFTWFESIDLGNNEVTPGKAAHSIFKMRAAALMQRVHPGDSVLDIGEGEGFYVFELEAKGVRNVHFMSLANEKAFEYARLRRRSNIKRISANLGNIDAINSNGFDCVILRSVLNQVPDPVAILRSATKATRRLLIVELALDLPDLERPAMVYYGAERRPGYPSDGYGMNKRFVTGVLKNLGFDSVGYLPTPDSPHNRGIFLAEKWHADPVNSTESVIENVI